MARREEGGLNKPAKQPSNAPIVPKTRSSLVWPEGRARPLPTLDRDLARRLAQSPMDFEDLMPWIKGQLELDPPDTPPEAPSYVLNPGDVTWDPAAWGCAGEPDVSGGSGAIAAWLVPSLSSAIAAERIPCGTAGNTSLNFYPQVRLQVTGATSSNFQIGWELDGVSQGLFDSFVAGTDYVQGDPFDTGWVTHDTGTALASALSGSCGQMALILQGYNGNGGFAAMLGPAYLALRWVYLEDGTTDSLPDGLGDLPAGADAGDLITWNGSMWVVQAETDANARVGARINSTGTPSKRRTINFIEGTGIDLTIADDSGNEEVDLTLAVDKSELGLLSTDLGDTVGIAKGGTGQTTAGAAFDALSPATTVGDLITYDGADNVRLARGADGYFLKSDDAAGLKLSWAIPSAGSVAWADVTGKPFDFPPEAHTHVAADIDSEAATSGYVLKADGVGGASWAADATGGGGGSGTPKMVAVWSGHTPPRKTGAWGGVWRIPEVFTGAATFDLSQLTFRMETPPNTAYTLVVEKSASGGTPSWSTVKSITLAADDYEQAETTSLGTVDSGELLRVRFTAIGSGGADWSITLEGEDNP